MYFLHFKYFFKKNGVLFLFFNAKSLLLPIKNERLLFDLLKVYILFGKKSTDFLWGKTIHNTITTNEFTVHNGGESIEVPIEYGHLSHFRQAYNLHWGSSSIYSIYELMFDFNYYNCYFKTIIKEFGFDFKQF